ncbi:hypothetical protein [Thermogutta sp.]|uniref:hypothetical protein n=1 Tax=Thermogutta sp. TaxID=1962930 RepID=UPI00322056DF
MTTLYRYFLRECGKLLTRRMKGRIPVDTGFARQSITWEYDTPHSVRAGILNPLVRDGSRAVYPVLIDQGIKRHFLPVISSTGEVRHLWEAWLRHHHREDALPKIITRGPRKGMLSRGGLMVWGYRVAWCSGTMEESRPEIEQMFARLRLGEGQ